MDEEGDSRGLRGLRVVELGGPVAAPAAGKLMADLGATVVKVEPPEGDPGRGRPPFPPTGAASAHSAESVGGHFLHLNTNKRSLMANLATAEGRALLDSLLAGADLLLHDLPAPLPEELDAESLAARHPHLVVVALTPFGLDGPYAGYRGGELPLVHGGGLAWLTPDRIPPPDNPPLRPYGVHALMQLGLHGAVAGLAAWLGGSGGELVDVSGFEVGVNLLCRHFTSYTYSGLVESRLGRNVAAPATFFPCKDGMIYIIAVEQDQWERLVEMMGNPAWADDPAYGSTKARGVPAAMERIERGLAEWCAEWEMDALFHALQAKRIGSSPVYHPAELAHEPHLESRGFFRELDHGSLGRLTLPGAPYVLERSPWALRHPAPGLGEANSEAGDQPARLFPPRPIPALQASAPTASRGPLSGVRVLDLSWVWAGPYTAQLLAFLGAEVIKVESSGRVDIARRLNLFPKGMEPGVNRNAYFNQIAQGKQSVAVNLRHPEGLATVKRLAARSDVVLSNFATGVMERLGLGREELRAIKPDLIVANLSAYGQTGPYRHYIGYGPAMPSLAGLAALTGYEGEGEPQNLRVAYADPNAGVYLAFAIVAELAARRLHPPSTGQAPHGQGIDIALWETLVCTAFEGWMAHALGAPEPVPLGNHDPEHTPHNLYRCRGEDAWVAVAVTDEAAWRGLCRALDRADWAAEPGLGEPSGRKAREAELDAVLAAWCGVRDKWEVTRLLQGEGVPAFPALNNRELAEDEHLHARGFLLRHDHPEVGGLLHNGIPWRMRGSPLPPPARAPLLGEHTDVVLAGVLDLQPAEIAALREAGAIE